MLCYFTARGNNQFGLKQQATLYYRLRYQLILRKRTDMVPGIRERQLGRRFGLEELA